MAQSQIHAIRLEYYVRPKQMDILEQVASHEGKTVEQYLASAFELMLGAQVENPELTGRLIEQVWRAEEIKSELITAGREKIRVEIVLPENQMHVFALLKGITDKYDPSYFQRIMNEAVRSQLEAMNDEADGRTELWDRLHTEWKGALGQ